jgi:D-serine deaminase-like pyridoxal phosphate-dependent protein
MQIRFYAELADGWPLVSSPADYAEEASQYAALLTTACHPCQVLETEVILRHRPA